jgi:hypothetical protein
VKRTFLFLWYWGLNSGPSTGYASILPLEHAWPKKFLTDVQSVDPKRCVPLERCGGLKNG